MDITEVSILHHIALVLFILWILASFGWSHPFVFFGSLLYLYKVNERYSLRLKRRLQFEERKYANQRKLLSDSESVRWLNHAIEKIWPICMEQIASQQFILPIIPWFLDKYKPWTARKAVVQHLYLGRNPPMFTEMRVLGNSGSDDHLVLELGMSFLSGQDMSAVLEVQLRKRLGFGIRTNLHLTSMHVEGKVLVGVKFLPHWPFLGRVRVCFVEPPYFQMTVKPIFSHGVDVTELPGIAGWLDKILAVAFEQTLVEPNMLVVDVEKFVSAPKEAWFTVNEKPPIAYVKLEIVEAADMKSSDMNGLADPYVKGQLGSYRFRTKVQKKTLAPKWLEEFKIPICSWETPNLLALEVRDKDHIFDDTLGDCSINLSQLRGGQRYDKWLPLQNIKKGRLHIGITVVEVENEKNTTTEGGIGGDEELSKATVTENNKSDSMTQEYYNTDVTFDDGQKLADEFEPINIEGQPKTGVWVHHPGSEVCQTWEPRKGRVRRQETHLCREDIDCTNSPGSLRTGSNHSDTSSNDELVEGNKSYKPSMLRRGLHKFGNIFHKNSRNDSFKQQGDPAICTPRPNLRAVGDKGIEVKLILDESCNGRLGGLKSDRVSCSLEKGEEESLEKSGNSSSNSFNKSAMGGNEPENAKEDQVPQTAVRDSFHGSDLPNKVSKDCQQTAGGAPVNI